jgi:aminoglycoside phosphotransferase (APT) family kinase protein
MEEFIDRSTDVRKGEELDAAKLEAFLLSNVAGATGSLSIEQFPQGFSNLTYLLKMGSQEMVLRRPPFGNQVKSAHDMGREYRVLSALAPIYELAPRPLASCEDESVIGAPFYVMERRRGIILRKQPPKDLDLSPETMRRLGEAFIKNLARLHDLDYEAAGLGDLGRPNGFVQRQIEGWKKRYHRALTDDVPEMHQVEDWLAANAPQSDDAGLIHNDYKYDNVLLDPDDPTKLIAVLDWEMCTIGTPLMDLGCTMAYWVQADDVDELKAFVAGPTNRPGSPTRRELIDIYAQHTGRDTSNLLVFYCFGLYKLAVIVQQIYFRYAKGFTRDPRFAQLNHVVTQLSRAALLAIERNRI